MPRGQLGGSLGVATTLHFSGPKGTPGGHRAYTRELEDSLTPCGRLAAGARGAGGGSRPPSNWGGAFCPTDGIARHSISYGLVYSEFPATPRVIPYRESDVPRW